MPVRVIEKPKYKIKIKRNDQVVVIAGKDAGKKGRVLRVLADKNRVLVEGVMMMKKHVKPDPQKRTQGGIVEQEATIHLSNVMLVDSEGNKTRTGTRIDGDTKIRIAKSNDQPIAADKAAKRKK
jgi:large subunit ribosomal protein L24